jgi:hypothetical protein
MRFTVGQQAPERLARPSPRRAGEPELFEERRVVPDPPAVPGLDAPRRCARRAREQPRQDRRIGDADVAAGAGDADQHGVAPKKAPAFTGAEVRRRGKTGGSILAAR